MLTTYLPDVLDSRAGNARDRRRRDIPSTPRVKSAVT